MTYDDFFFYLPGYASVPLAAAGVLTAWLIWRLLRKRKAPPRAEKPLESGIPKPPSSAG